MSEGKRNGEETTVWEEISACFVGVTGGRSGLWRKDERKTEAPQRFPFRASLGNIRASSINMLSISGSLMLLGVFEMERFEPAFLMSPDDVKGKAATQRFIVGSHLMNIKEAGVSEDPQCSQFFS